MVRASAGVRAAVAAGIAALWAAVLGVLLVLSLDVHPGWVLGCAAGAAVPVFLLVLLADGPARRSAARQVGWTGSLDYFMRVQVDADHGVLPTVEPARELAYRLAALSWSRRWTLRTLAALVALTLLAPVVLAVYAGGWLAAPVVYLFLTVTALNAYPAWVLLPRHRRILRAVDSR